MIQFNTWVSCDSSNPSLPAVCTPGHVEEHIYLEDVHTHEDKLNSSMLSSESTFLPFTSDLEPQSPQSDSEDETETFEPDSLAPQRPAQPNKYHTNKTHHLATVDKQKKETQEEVKATVPVGSLVVSSSTQQHYLDTSSYCEADVKEIPKEEETVSCATKSGSADSDCAAVKIQTWWRGQFTRRCHPTAREVRSEIRLRRMQDHILFLSEKLDRYLTYHWH